MAYLLKSLLSLPPSPTIPEVLIWAGSMVARSQSPHVRNTELSELYQYENMF